MFCRNGGMQPQHTYQPVFGTDGAMLYKKRAKKPCSNIFFAARLSTGIPPIIKIPILIHQILNPKS
jgi:hypothetical protein